MKTILLISIVCVIKIGNASIPDGIWIHYTGSLKGLVDPCVCKIPAGGISERLGEIQQLQKVTYDQLHILVDAGEWTDNIDPIDGDKKTICLLKSMMFGPLKAVNVSLRDFFRQNKMLDTLKQFKDIPLISANLRDTLQRQIFPSFRIVDTTYAGKKVRIGIIGLTDPSFNRTMTKRNGLIALNWTFILKDVRKELEEKKCDIQILLTDALPNKLDTLLVNEQPFDLIISSSPYWKSGQFTLKPYGLVVAPEVQGKKWEAVVSKKNTSVQWEVHSRPLVPPLTKISVVDSLIANCKRHFKSSTAPENLLRVPILGK